MITHFLLVYFLPLIFSILLALPVRFGERTITRLSTLALLLPALVSLTLVSEVLRAGPLAIESTPIEFHFLDHLVGIHVWIDRYTIAMLSLTHILGLLVVKYSHGYLHLEKGYQRFFSTILFFIFGMYVLSLAGDLDIFFAGWEIVGLSSFLLIAFYRSHTRSVKNAWRIYNIYRVCDLGLLMGAVMGHVLWHEATRFSVLAGLTPQDFMGVHQLSMTVIAFFMILASLGKSAQFPFHNWPARAMEGPTPSSAIFYGALSIHAGVFLLIRTWPIWSHLIACRIFIGLIGAVTVVLSTIQGRVQSNIKGQIAYASTAQIGVMFVELSLGLTDLVMLHLFFHALYRCFQLLVSPSIVYNSLGLQNRVVRDRLRGIDKTPSETLYVMAMSDFSMDPSWRGFGFLPWKVAYRLLQSGLGRPYLILPALFGISFLLPEGMRVSSALIFSALYLSVRALLSHSPFRALSELTLSYLLLMVGLYRLDSVFSHSIIGYMGSVGPALLLSLWISWPWRNLDLRNFHALGTGHTLKANLFMLCFLVIAGMPVSTAFIGEDVMLEELINHSLLLTAVTSLCLMLSGLICVKIYTRLFMGRPGLTDHRTS